MKLPSKASEPIVMEKPLQGVVNVELVDERAGDPLLHVHLDADEEDGHADRGHCEDEPWRIRESSNRSTLDECAEQDRADDHDRQHEDPRFAT